MLWILLALLIVLSWALWFIFQVSLWIPALATTVVLCVACGLSIYRFFRARRSAKALELALAAQGEQQARNARPERRAEIQALAEQLQAGIRALKASKLGGKRRGARALYALPWYAFIGPPGAGKTTAIRHSGLVFPYADSAVRGVGGTRNCDWWFTNDAILLDTAGRYATEQSDSAEWLAFLGMLRKFRSHKPLNGLLVAIAITDVIDATDTQIETMGKTLRARIDEVMNKLGMTLPVYFLITKTDLIAGFSEFFGSLRKSERAQALGATFNLAEDKRDPGALFCREFDLLVQQIHATACKRLVREPSRQAREAVFQFPLEFAAIRSNLRDLVAQVLAINAFQSTPVFRGFYFTSGTQDGTPLGRVVQRMHQAMGISSHAQPQMVANVESRSYFLHDVFKKIVFPDAEVASRSDAEIRRRRIIRVAVSVTALLVALVMAVPSVASYLQNGVFISDTKRRSKIAASILWNDGKGISKKAMLLMPMVERLRQFDDHAANGVPFGMRFLMYQGDRLHRPAMRVYVANMQNGFVSPCKYHLERQLIGIRGKNYVEERRALKMLLMLSDVKNLDVDWATGAFTTLWAELFRSSAEVPMDELKNKMRPLIHYYFELIKPHGSHARARFVPGNDSVIKHARDVLMTVPVRKRYYAFFVGSVSHELYDPAGDHTRDNLQFPPLTLRGIFADRPEVVASNFLFSKQFKKHKTWFAVDGPYTDKGHHAVLGNIKKAAQLLALERWVVPLTNEERGENLGRNLDNLKRDYEKNYIAAWTGFFLDLQIKTPTDLKDAIRIYNALQVTEWPYRRLIRRLEDHTQWRGNGVLKNKTAVKAANRRMNRALTKHARGLRFGVNVKDLEKHVRGVPDTFQSVVAIGVPKGGSRAPVQTTTLSRYMDLLSNLREKMKNALDQQHNAGVESVEAALKSAMQETSAMIPPRDTLARRLWLPLLQRPLNVGGRIR